MKNENIRNQNELTLEELKNMLPKVVCERVPKASELIRCQSNVIALKKVRDVTLIVFENGFALYDDGIHCTVLIPARIHYASYKYFLDDEEKKEKINLNPIPWDSALIMIGDERVEQGNMERSLEHLWLDTDLIVYKDDIGDSVQIPLESDDDIPYQYIRKEEQAEAHRIISLLCSGLTELQMEVLYRHLVEEMSFNAIAGEMRQSKQSVYRIFHRAFDRIEKNSKKL